MTMRKSKYDSMPLSQQGKNNDSENDNINAIEKRIEHSAEVAALAEQTKIVKQLIAELQRIVPYVERTTEEYRNSAKAFDAAVQSSNNIIDSICRAIARAEKTVVTAKLTTGDKDALAAYRYQLVEEEKKLLEAQIAELKMLHESNWKNVHKFIKAESGFYLTGWVAKFIFISFWGLYVYFCITLGLWILSKYLL